MRFEKTKPICGWAKLTQSLLCKGLMTINRPAEPKKTKPIKANFETTRGGVGRNSPVWWFCAGEGGDYEAVRGQKNRVCVPQPDALCEERPIRQLGPDARESSNTSRAANQYPAAISRPPLLWWSKVSAR